MAKKTSKPKTSRSHRQSPGPFELCVLSAFTDDDPAHDALTIAAYLDRGPGKAPSRPDRMQALTLAAFGTLADLRAMGYLTRNEKGMNYLAHASTEATTTTSKQVDAAEARTVGGKR